MKNPGLTPRLANRPANQVHLFIDTNIFLSFFSYTNDDLEQLKKLVAAIQSKGLRLYLTDQVVREFHRNREKKALEAIDNFKINLAGLPRLMAHHEVAQQYLEVSKLLRQLHNTLVKDVKASALARSLPADALFESLAAVSSPLATAEDVMHRARQRTDVNDPPGKPGSLGDRLNWELLLKHVPDVDLYVVSKDGDFASLIDKNVPHPVLVDEWRRAKQSKLTVYAELAEFFAKHFPQIKVAEDAERRAAIDRFKSSSSFGATHAAIENLAPFVSLLTAPECDELVDAGLENPQIHWIGKDDDVQNLMLSVASGRLSQYSALKQARFNGFFGPDEQEPV